jgi:hypothetical protein
VTRASAEFPRLLAGADSGSCRHDKSSTGLGKLALVVFDGFIERLKLRRAIVQLKLAEITATFEISTDFWLTKSAYYSFSSPINTTNGKDVEVNDH